MRYARQEYKGTNMLETTVQARWRDQFLVHIMCTRKRELSPINASPQMPLLSAYDGVLRIASMSSSTNCLMSPVFAT